MSIQELVTVLTPPNVPIETGNSDSWPSIEKALETPLPSDYKEYINTFGTGIIGYLIRVLNPFSSRPLFALFFQVNEIISTRKWYKAKFGDDWCPYPLYPEPDGLLPWANTIDGDALFWYTRGRPETWPIVVAEVKSKDFEVFDLPTTSFLRQVITGGLTSNILAEIDLDRLFELPTGAS
ncbi:MAG: SMI1/KNR4 family protein [Kouleothrix sp.]|nr:SMI1/KNR4 family protein [Kouleothrix sp.]